MRLPPIPLNPVISVILSIEYIHATITMSHKKESESDKELGFPNDDLQDREGVEKHAGFASDDINAQNLDHISQTVSDGDQTRVSREPSLARKQSNVITRVASRITTKSVKDPGPPPDGGFERGYSAFAAGWL
jgi:hypothetical protein